jgi:hypothetical protein
MESEMLKKLREYFDNTPREQVLKDWAEVEAMDMVGPTIHEFMGWNPVEPKPMGWNPVEPKPMVFKIDSYPIIQTKFNFLSSERYNINTEMHLCC